MVISLTLDTFGLPQFPVTPASKTKKKLKHLIEYKIYDILWCTIYIYIYIYVYPKKNDVQLFLVPLPSPWKMMMLTVQRCPLAIAPWRSQVPGPRSPIAPATGFIFYTQVMPWYGMVWYGLKYFVVFLCQSEIYPWYSYGIIIYARDYGLIWFTVIWDNTGIIYWIYPKW